MYMINKPDDYLVHHGVKGMKWGVRKDPERYISRTAKKMYRLEKSNSARSIKRGKKLEEKLENYVNTNRTPAKDAALKRAVEREKQHPSGGKGSALKTTAKIVSPVGYAVGKGIHKAATSKKARSARNTLRNLTGSKRSAAMTKYRKKNIDGMSDADLRKAVNRMNLERQYRDLTKADYMKGQRYASDFLKYKSTMKRF